MDSAIRVGGASGSALGQSSRQRCLEAWRSRVAARAAQAEHDPYLSVTVRRSFAIAVSVVLASALLAAPVAAAKPAKCLRRGHGTGRVSKTLQTAVDAASAGASLEVTGTCVGSTLITKDIAITRFHERRLRPAHAWTATTPGRVVRRRGGGGSSRCGGCSSRMEAPDYGRGHRHAFRGSTLPPERGHGHQLGHQWQYGRIRRGDLDRQRALSPHPRELDRSGQRGGTGRRHPQFA